MIGRHLTSAPETVKGSALYGERLRGMIWYAQLLRILRKN